LLTERQKQILQAIVDEYIKFAEPIGSRSISKIGDIPYSSATIRNEMADLEEMGYLEQPHTSAGRIPTNKGYRYYVDNLIELQGLVASKKLLSGIREHFAKQKSQFEQVLEETANILSELTTYTSIIMGPDLHSTRLSRLEIVPLDNHSLVIVIVTDSGRVESQTINLPQELAPEEIERLVRILNYQLTGTPLHQLKQRIEREIQETYLRNMHDYERVSEIINELTTKLDLEPENKIYLGGTVNLLNQPEFSNVESIRRLLGLFQHTELVKHLLSRANEGIEVRIGLESDIAGASNLSVITASYQVAGRPMGTIGIFGPTRMDYNRVIKILDALTEDYSEYILRYLR
jgi:heat-inducible transcriptional repressor